MSSELYIDRFWNWFSANSNRFRSMNTPRKEELLNEILENLHLIDDRLYFEVSDPVNEINGFVVTAGGKRELFSLVDCIVAMAPRLDGWTFAALKPPMGFDFVTEHGGIKLDPHTLWFMPLTGGPSGDDLGLRIGIPGLNDVDKNTALFASWILLDTAIGERKMATGIQHLEVIALPNDPSDCGYVALPELRDYLDSRDTRSR